MGNNDKDNNKKKLGGGVGVVAAAVVIGFLLSKGGGLLPGNGSGVLPGDGKQEERSVEETQAAEEEAKEAAADEEIPATIVVSIKEDKVTINGHPAANEDELRKYIEDYNSDSRTFVLEEDQSILETYNWVKSTFADLDIELKNSK